VTRLLPRSCVRSYVLMEEATPTSLSARCRRVSIESVRSSTGGHLLLQELFAVSGLLVRASR
jgi:hypothetical protein